MRSTSPRGKKGTIKWKMDPGTDRAWAGDVACCGVNNRGVALWKDKVISIALDGRMFAINKATGEVVWERKIADPAIGETLTIAPLIVRDLAIVGTAGGEFGIRGFIEATDLNTGKAAWRTYTIPGAGEPGNETWKDGEDRWKHGGGSIWETATYDPETDTFYQGVGNAGPDWDAEYRPGDNKWAASVLAITAADGKIKWGFQYTPNDPYDYDEISEHPIINAKVNGEDRKLVVHAARNGFFYALDRINGSFISGKQYVDQLNWTPGPRSQDRPPAQLRSRRQRPDLQRGQPRHAGEAAERQAVPVDPGRQELGAVRLQSANRPALRSLHRRLRRHPDRRAEGHGGPGRRGEIPRTLHRRRRRSGRSALYGSLKAIDPVTGETKARREARPTPISPARSRPPATSCSSATSTAPSRAYDAKTLQEVWSFNTGTGINAPPVSYSVNGKQYIAVLVGARQPANLMQNMPELKNTTTASMLFVFSLVTTTASSRKVADFSDEMMRRRRA